MNAKEFLNNGFGCDVEKIHRNQVIELMENFAKQYQALQLQQTGVSGSLLSFEQCLREEFLINTQNYPKEYHQLFKQKFERAEKRFKEQSGNDR